MSAARSSPTAPGRAERLVVACVIGCASVVVSYATIRLVQLVFFPEPNPVVVVWSGRVGYFWRLAIASYLGGAIALQAYAFLGSGRRLALAVRVLPALVASAFAVALVQGVLWP